MLQLKSWLQYPPKVHIHGSRQEFFTKNICKTAVIMLKLMS
jgi:hypothetical protein